MRMRQPMKFNFHQLIAGFQWLDITKAGHLCHNTFIIIPNGPHYIYARDLLVFYNHQLMKALGHELIEN